MPLPGKNPNPCTLGDAAVVCGRSIPWLVRTIRRLKIHHPPKDPTYRISRHLLHRLFWLALWEDWERDLRVPTLKRLVRPAYRAGLLPGPFTASLKPSPPTPPPSCSTPSTECKT